MNGDNGHYRLNARVLCRIIEGEAVLLDLDSGQYYGLNDVGTRIWQLTQEGHPPSAICDCLVDEYDVPREDAEHDVTQFLEDLADKGLLARPRGSRVVG